jgi:hypothetical protein
MPKGQSVEEVAQTIARLGAKVTVIKYQVSALTEEGTLITLGYAVPKEITRVAG